MNFKKNGFTLIELSIILGIIMIISIFSLPLINSYQKTTKLKSEARILATNLRLTQQLAITEQIIYKLTLLPETKEYKIIKSSTDAVIKTVRLDPEISISQITGLTGNSVSYIATGGTLETGTIILTNSLGHTSELEIKPSGYIQITD
jgi:Tfp pilus assembly protein FimT